MAHTDLAGSGIAHIRKLDSQIMARESGRKRE
jgi:hypothetical protein